MIRLGALIFLLLIVGCAPKSELAPSKVVDTFNFDYELEQPQNAGVIQAFSDNNTLYIQIVPRISPFEQITLTNERGDALVSSEKEAILKTDYLKNTVHVLRDNKQSTVRYVGEELK